MRKEFLLGSAAEVVIGESPVAPEKSEPDVKIRPPSIAMGLLKNLVAFIVKRQYETEDGFLVEDIFYDDADDIEDDIIHLCFTIKEDDPKIMTATKAACEEFLEDLQQINEQDGGIQIKIDELSLYAASKINLFAALSLYMADENIELSTLDCLQIEYVSQAAKEYGSEAQRQARDEAFALHAAEGRELWENKDNRDKLLEYVEAKPYPTQKHFEAAVAKVTQVDIPMSMSHIHKTILRESGVKTPESPDDAYNFGGYH